MELSKLVDFFDAFRASVKNEEQLSPISKKDLEPLFHGLRTGVDVLAERGGQVDLWDIVGIGSNEVRNCRVLGWLLDPKGSHQQGTLFLKALAQCLEPELPQDLFDCDINVYLERTGIFDETSRIDIQLESPRLLLFIEVKIAAAETNDQLRRYWEEGAKQKASRTFKLVYLTPRNRPPSDPKLRDCVVTLSWKNIAAAIRMQLQSVDELDPVTESLVYSLIENAEYL